MFRVLITFVAGAVNDISDILNVIIDEVIVFMVYLVTFSAIDFIQGTSRQSRLVGRKQIAFMSP